MSIYVVSEQAGLDGFWINDILKGIKAEADKKNLRTENFFLPEGTIYKEPPVVLAVGCSVSWFSSTCRRIREEGGIAVAVNASPSASVQADAYVGFDYDTAMERLISYLYYYSEKSRIAFVGCRGGRLSFDSKKTAFIRAAEKNGTEFEVLPFTTMSEMSSAIAKRHYNYDAVICSRDAEANHLISSLLRRRIYIPDDLFVVGFGGDKVSQSMQPTLTSARLDFQSLGTAAVRLQRYLIHNGNGGKISNLLECPIVIGGSTKNIPFTESSSGPPLQSLTYNTDNDYVSYLRAETLVRLWDQLDRKIVKELCKGKNMSLIAEEMFISQSSVKYRVKKMLTEAGIEDRHELIKTVQKFDLL